VRYSPAVYSAFAPPPKLQLSTWMEEHIRLPAGDAAVPGRIRLYGYQRGIADAIGDPLIERVTVIKSARIGYTTLLVGALANYVHNDPSSSLCLLPVKDDARNFVVSQVEPVFAESPVVRAKLDAPKSHAHDRDTMLFRRFTCGSLRVVSAEAQRAACTRRVSATSPAPPQAKLSRNSKPIPRGGGIRQFESYMPSQAVRSLGGMAGLEKCFRPVRGPVLRTLKNGVKALAELRRRRCPSAPAPAWPEASAQSKRPQPPLRASSSQAANRSPIAAAANFRADPQR
jgi:hypothetical protein